MIGDIFIKGTIGDFDEGEYTELVDVVAQVNKQKDATSYKVHINTVGGYTCIAKQIRKYLMGLAKSGKVIHTHGHGIVASSGTIIHSTGTIRTVEPNTAYMIHLPSGGIEGTSDDILAYSDMMQKEQKEIIDIYSEVTGLTKDALVPLVSNETWLTPKQAYELNFLTEEPVEIKAVAKYNKPVNTMKNQEKQKISNEDKKFLNGFFEKLTQMFGADEPKNIVVQTAVAEVEIDFANVPEGEQIKVGDVGTINGAPAEGEHAIPSGEIYVFVDSAISEIKPAESELTEEEEEMKALRALFEALEATNKANVAELKDVKAKYTETKTKLANASAEFEKFKTTVKSTFDFTEMKSEPKDEKEVKNQMMVNLEERRKKRK